MGCCASRGGVAVQDSFSGVLPDDEHLRGGAPSQQQATAEDMELFMQLKVAALREQGLIVAEESGADEAASPNPWQANRARGEIVSA